MEASSLPRDYLTGAVADRLAPRITSLPLGAAGEVLGAMPLAETEGTAFGSCLCDTKVCPRPNPPGSPDTHTHPCAPDTTRGC